MIATIPFGRTGHDSTRIIFGAAAFSSVTQDVADDAMQIVLENGINHIDVAASYGDAELRLGPWMETHRDRFFLATKTGERSYASAWDEIRRSLERLRTDHVDLIQLHALHTEEDWQRVYEDDGALQAAIRARDEGLARFIGVTGHGVEVARFHIRSLEQFDFDAVLLPYSYVMMMNPRYAADFEELMAICRERNVAVQTIKGITKAPWGDREHTTSTWYEPLQEQDEIDVAVSWVLGRDGIFLNTASDIELLRKTLDAAHRSPARPTDEEMRRLVESSHMEPLFT